MSKTAKTITFPIVLKSIIAIAIAEKTIVDGTRAADPKNIRAKLRADAKIEHLRNTSWVAFNARDLHNLRVAFDPVYVERLAAARKRNTRKDVTTSNDVVAS